MFFEIIFLLVWKTLTWSIWGEDINLIRRNIQILVKTMGFSLFPGGYVETFLHKKNWHAKIQFKLNTKNSKTMGFSMFPGGYVETFLHKKNWHAKIQFKINTKNSKFCFTKLGPKFYLKNGSFWLFLVYQNCATKHPVVHRHIYVKVSSLRSPTNFNKGLFSCCYSLKHCLR